MAVDVMQKKEIHLDHSGIHLMWSLLDLSSMDPYIMMCITMICPPSGMRNILQTNGLVCIAYYKMRVHCIMYWNIIWLCVHLPVFQNSWAWLHLLFWISNSELQTTFRLVCIYTYKYFIPHFLIRIQGSAVDIVISLCSGWSECQFPAETKDFSLLQNV